MQDPPTNPQIPILQLFLSEDNITLGRGGGGGHAWVSLNLEMQTVTLLSDHYCYFEMELVYSTMSCQ